ncbi:unnamed protein product [Phytophthora fragariaefolia]|uniref:Unnamed protein product n=1 Tax=Phytophthora fragariaefolia TaxID=1490495 RepID=A0A9W6XZC0_9STRA|nr:unnamed protein product [Phytophthora fragariaefolia]
MRSQAPETSFFNLLSQLATGHPGYRESYDEKQESLEAHGFVDQRTMESYRWMECIIAPNQADSDVDDPLTRSLAAIKPVVSMPLMLYMHHVAAKVGN